MRYAALIISVVSLDAVEVSLGKNNFVRQWRGRPPNHQKNHHQLHAYKTLKPRAPPVIPPPPPSQYYPRTLNLVGGAREDPLLLMQQEDDSTSTPDSSKILNPTSPMEVETESGQSVNGDKEFSSYPSVPSGQKTAFVKRNMSGTSHADGFRSQIKRLKDKAATTFMMSPSTEKKVLGEKVVAGRRGNGGAASSDLQKVWAFFEPLDPQ